MPVGSPSRWPLVAAAACIAVGLAVLAFALTTSADEVTGPPARPAIPVPAIAAVAATPPPSRSGVPGDPIADMRAAWRRKLEANERASVPPGWVAGFYPLYERAQDAFGVNWLLIASVHLQETAFSTARGTYRGLNFANCCAGPMQFNVTNGDRGIPSTWQRYRHAYRRAPRPTSYPNPTARHPSVYDDFDAIMAGASLLSHQGAGTALDGAAWQAAYDYYGHDLDGIGYADEVLARAIGWSQRGFSVDGAVDPALRDAGDAAWGAPARAQLLGGDSGAGDHR